MKKISDWFAGAKAGVRRNVGTKIVAMVAAVAMLGGVAGVSMTAMAEEGQTPDAQTTQQANSTDTATTNDDVSADGAATDNAADPAQPAGDATATDGTADKPAADGATAETAPIQSGDAAQQSDSPAKQDAAEADDASAATDIAKQSAPAPADANAADSGVAPAAVTAAGGCNYATDDSLQPVCWLDMTNFGQNVQPGTNKPMSIDLGGGYTLEFNANYTTSVGSLTLSATAAPISWTTGSGGGHAAFGYRLYKDAAGKGEPVLYTSQASSSQGSGTGTVTLSNIKLKLNGSDTTVPYSLIMADGESTGRNEQMVYSSNKSLTQFAESSGFGLCRISSQTDTSATCDGANDDSSGSADSVQGIRLFKTDNPDIVSVQMKGARQGVVFGVLTASAQTTVTANGAPSDASFHAQVSVDSRSESADLTGTGTKSSNVIQVISQQGEKKTVDFTLTGADPSVYDVEFSCSNGGGSCSGTSSATYDANSKTWSATAQIGALDSAHGRWIITKRLGEPEHHKYIKDNKDGTYELSLDVKGATQESSSQERQPVDIVVVFDTSGSMSNMMGSDTRLQVAKNAVNSMAKALLTTDNAQLSADDQVRMAVVQFSTTASTAQGFTTSQSNISAKVNNFGATGGTNWEAALSVANSLNSGRANAKKYIVFMSDGDPTFRNTGNGYNDYNSKYRVYGTGNSDPDNRNFNAAVTEANGRAKGVTLYSVGLSTDPQNMKDFASKTDGTYYLGTDSDSLNKAFESIISDISRTASYKKVVITDTLSDYAEFAKDGFGSNDVTVKASNGDDLTGKYMVTVDGKTVTVKFSDDYELKSDVTYTATFTIKPSQKAYDDYVDTGYNSKGDPGTDAPDNTSSSDKDGFHSNAKADLTYCVATTVTGSASSSTCKDGSGVYDHPVIQVKTGSLTVTKKWVGDESDATHGEVTVKVSKTDANGVKTDVGTLKLSDADEWTDTLAELAPGYTYTVDEVLVDGYQSEVSYEGNDNTLTVDDVWGANADKTSVIKATVTNTRKTVDLADGSIEVGKTLSGRGWKDGDSFTFDIKAKYPATAPLPDEATVTIGKDTAGHAAGFGKITYDAVGTYKYTVTERSGEIAGLHYSGAEYEVTVVVESDQATGALKVRPVTIARVKDDNGKTVSGTADTASFTNTFIAVSSLPLTGGTTARDWLVYGGGMGLAALLAGAGFTVWRKRQLV